MATALMWPEWVLVPKKVLPLFLMPRNVSGGTSDSGEEALEAAVNASRWRIGFSDISVRTDEAERVWKVIARRLSGMSGAIMVPAMARRTAPWSGLGISKIAVTLTDAILFSGGSAYRGGDTAATISALAFTAFAKGDTEADVKVAVGGELKPGMIFQYGEYVAMITEIVDVDPGGGSPVWTVAFTPPSREDVAENDILDFDNPRFRARLAEGGGMDGLTLSNWKTGNPSVVFEEDY